MTNSFSSGTFIFSPFSIVFQNEIIAFEFLLEKAWVKKILNCPKCSYLMNLNTNLKTGLKYYRCVYKKCCKKLALKMAQPLKIINSLFI